MSSCESLPCCRAIAKVLTGAGLERQTTDRFGLVELDTQERPVARPRKTTATKPAATAMAPVRAKRRSADVDLAPVASTPIKAREARSVPTSAAAVKPTSGRGRPAAVATPEAAPTRVPPPSKGELRAQIEKLETANATLKAKSRERNRAAKSAARRITELEEQVAQFQEAAARAVDPAAVMEELQAAKAALQAKGREASRAAKLAERRVAELEAQVEHLQGEAAKTATPAVQEGEAKRSRRGRPPGRKNAIDPGAVPPGVAVLESAPMDPEAEAARNALEENLSEAQVQEDK